MVAVGGRDEVMAMEKVLVATDGSECAQEALAWAARLAAAARCKVVVASVVEPFYAENPIERVTDRIPTDWLAALDDGGVDHEEVVLEGDPRAELMTLTAGDVDLVVVGTRGSGGFQGLGLGGVAHFLARRVRAP